MKRKITTLLFTLCAFFLLNAQKFVPLTDASGIGLTTEQLTSLENAAQEAVNILPSTDQPLFKVYDVGFYVHTPVTLGGIPEVWDEVVNKVENDPNSEYYLIFGRESRRTGLNTKIRVKLKLPTSPDYSCLTEEERGNLERYIEVVANDNLSFGYTQAEIAALEFSKKYFHNIIECGCFQRSATDCEQFDVFTISDIKLCALGFRKKEIQIGGASTWNSGAQGIFDFAGKKVIIDGTEYDIADQVSENKAVFEANSQVLPDTTINTSITGEVYILDNESFTNGEWETAKAAASTSDYVEYWVILTDGSGKSFLYSKFTIGDFVPVAVADEDAPSRMAMVASPWGLALKALGNAAIDACIQAVIIRIVDPNAQDWYYAWGEVSYLGAAWEGLSSLIPWKDNIAKQVALDFTRAFVVVLDKAIREPDYTTVQGLIDFGVSISTSGFIRLTTHPKTVERIGHFNTGLAKTAFARGVKKLYKVSPPALQRVVLAAQKTIIGDGGNIVKMYDKYEARQYAEIFYRGMKKEQFDELKSTFKIAKTGETSTSPNASFASSYASAPDEVLVKLWVEPGTIDKLVKDGVSGNKPIHQLVKSTFGNLPITETGWISKKVQFKVETNKNVTPNIQQVNIQLGQGLGINTINDALIYFEKIN